MISIKDLRTEMKTTKSLFTNPKLLKQMILSIAGESGIAIYQNICSILKQLAGIEKKADKMSTILLKLIAELWILHKHNKILETEYDQFFEGFGKFFNVFYSFVVANSKDIGLLYLDPVNKQLYPPKTQNKCPPPTEIKIIECKVKIIELFHSLSKILIESIGHHLKIKRIHKIHELITILTTEQSLNQLSNFGSDVWKLICEIDDHIQGVIQHQWAEQVANLPRI